MAAATETAFAANPTYAGGSQIIQSPFQFVADADTFLRIVSACSIVGVTIAVQGRRLDDAGALQIIQETHQPNSDRSVKTQDYKLGPGALLNLSLFVNAGAPRIGQCFVQAQILRNFGGAAIVLGTILGGCITATQALGFPGSAVQSPLQSEPVLRTIVGTQPAAQANFTETVPTNARWDLLTFHADYAAVGNGNRNVQLVVDDGTHVVATSANDPISMATGTFSFEWWAGWTAFNTTNSPLITSALPPRVLLTAGSRLRSILGSALVGDQWAAPVYTVREFLDI